MKQGTMTPAEYKRSKKKGPKYKNQQSVIAGEAFDSKKEAARAQELKLMLRAGVIRDLVYQHSFPLCVNGRLICRYVSDFFYIENDEMVVEDVKSPATRKLPAYRIKYKLMQAVFGITIREI